MCTLNSSSFPGSHLFNIIKLRADVSAPSTDKWTPWPNGLMHSLHRFHRQVSFVRPYLFPKWISAVLSPCRIFFLSSVLHIIFRASRMPHIYEKFVMEFSKSKTYGTNVTLTQITDVQAGYLPLKCYFSFPFPKSQQGNVCYQVRSEFFFSVWYLKT